MIHDKNSQVIGGPIHKMYVIKYLVGLWRCLLVKRRGNVDPSDSVTLISLIGL